MENAKKISINEAPKALRLFLILLPAVGILMIGTQINNDFYFLYSTGDYILNNGFPVKDFLSMHSGMDIVVQQWLCDVVFYLLYSKLGMFGLFGFIYLCYAAFAVIMFRLCKLICNNEFIAAVCAFVADIFAAGIFFTTRPHSVSDLIFVAELYILERFAQTNNKKLLVILPALSLLLVNFHSSMWLLFFIFALPFAAEAIPLKIGKFKQEPCCSFAALLICGIISFAVGFINPYGTKAMFYIFTSFGYSEINDLIVEMAPTLPNNPLGIIFYITLLVMAVTVILTKQKNFRTRFVLLFFGTLALALMNLKSTGLFAVAAIPAFSYYLKDIDVKITVSETKRNGKDKAKIAVLCVLIAAVAAGGIFAVTLQNEAEKEFDPYQGLDEVADILDKEENVVLFAGFDYGQYLEYKGYHPYIDGRAELFLDSNNHEFNYLKEYCDIIKGDIDYKEFVNRYGFNYLLVSIKEKNMYEALKNDGSFEIVYRGGDEFVLFRTIKT